MGRFVSEGLENRTNGLQILEQFTFTVKITGKSDIAELG